MGQHITEPLSDLLRYESRFEHFAKRRHKQMHHEFEAGQEGRLEDLLSHFTEIVLWIRKASGVYAVPTLGYVLCGKEAA